jgi:sialidase-1
LTQYLTNNTYRTITMKKSIFYLCLLFIAQTAFAADSLYVREQQIPILIDRTDNVLLEMRIPAQKGDVLNNFTLQFGEETNLSDIKAVRLFYSGTEAPSREGTHFNPVTYVTSYTPGKTRVANPSYSVKQDEVTAPAKTIRLSSKQPMIKGPNYFWVSIEMKPETSLLSRVSFTMPEATINNKPAAIEWKGKAETPRRVGVGVRQAGDDGSAAFRIPGLVTTNNGTLLGVYDIRYNSSVDLQEMVDIGVSRSTDKGQTWEPMQVAMTFGETGGLPHAQNGVGDPSILVDEKTNTIWIVAAWTHGMGNGRAWWNSMPGMTPDETAQLMLVKSEDDGKTWSEPINITSQVKDPSWYFLLQGPGRGITMQDGTLVFPIQFIDATRVPNAGVMYSKDRGKTWHLHNLARTNTTEAQVAEVEPGVLMLNMRDNRGGSRAVAVTKDLGKTWTEHPSNRSALQEPVCMASLIKVDAKDNITGKKLLLFSNPNTTKGRNHITIKASLDGGLTWPAEHQVLLDENEGWGYSCLSMIDKETVGIFYESSVAHMTFQAIKLTDLIK